MRKILLSFVAAMTLLTGCKQAGEPAVSPLHTQQGPIRITGAFALYPLMSTWVKEYEKTHPGVTFELTAIGSGGGVDEVLAGRCDLAMVSAEVPEDQDTLLWVFPVANLGVVPVISAKNPYRVQVMRSGIRRDELMALFSNQHPKTWGDLYGKPGKDPVHVYVRSDKSGATDVLARYLVLQRAEIYGDGKPGEDSLVASVIQDPLSLGYCNLIYAIDPRTMTFREGFIVLPLDFNENGVIEHRENFYDSVVHLERAMWTGRYPYSLIRHLCLASKGFPKTREIVQFLEYCLTDGQKLVCEAGYVDLHRTEIQSRLKVLQDKLNE
jgi:phosphate transport system substrate-binding protein